MGTEHQTTKPNMETQGDSSPSQIPVFFFDLDECLYPQETRVEEISWEVFHSYLKTRLDVKSKDDITRLLDKYRKEHGFVLEGLFRDPRVDTMDFNTAMDDGLPLESILKTDLKLCQLLQDIDTSKVRLWILTNSYITHAKRVLKLLGVDEFFEGVTYLDYFELPLTRKPMNKMWEKAMEAAGVERRSDCFFIDDNYQNCRVSQEFGWTSVHLVEKHKPTPEPKASQHQIADLEELRTIFPHFFKA